MNPNATSFDMSFQFNPAAAEFTPSGAALEALTFGGKPALNAQAGVFVPDSVLEDASLAQGNNHDQYQLERGQGKRCRTRDRNRYKLSHTHHDRAVTQSMTPYYQWEASQLGNPQQDQQDQQAYASNGYGAGYQEYDNVSYYRGGKYGKAKKKSKKRDMRQVYGYNGSHKRAGAGSASHLQAAQQYYDAGDGRWYNANGSTYAYGANEPYKSAQPAGYAAESWEARYLDRNRSSGDAAYHQGRHAAAEISTSAMYNLQSGDHGHGHAHGLQNYGEESVDQQLATSDHMRSQSNIIPTTSSTNFNIPHTSYNSATLSAPTFASPNHQRTLSTSGSTIADSDFVSRFHTGAFASLADTVAMLFKEAEATYFPASQPTFEWPKKTEREMEYVNRMQRLRNMGEDELAMVYERVLGGGNW